MSLARQIALNYLMTLDQIKQYVCENDLDPREDDDAAFIVACKYTELDIPLYFLQLGAGINAQNGAALSQAIRCYNVKIVQLLLQHAAVVTNNHLKLSAQMYRDEDIFPLLLVHIAHLDDDLIPHIIRSHDTQQMVHVQVLYRLGYAMPDCKDLIIKHLIKLFRDLLQYGVSADFLCKWYVQENATLRKEILRLFVSYQVDITAYFISQ